MLGRRGAAQASFTTPELRELGKLEVDVVVDPANIELDPASKAGIEDDRAARANLRHLQGYAARTERSAPRRITLRFLASPVEVLGSNGRVEAVRIERNELIVDHNGGLRSKGTGQFEVIEAGLVLRSIGYRTVPIEVPFDPATSTVNNIAGQITHPNSGEVTPGEYAAGWAKRGPPAASATTSPTRPRSRPWWPTCPPSRASATTSATRPRSRPCCAAAASTTPATPTGGSWTPTRSPSAPPGPSPGQGLRGPRDDGDHPPGPLTSGPWSRLGTSNAPPG